MEVNKTKKTKRLAIIIAVLLLVVVAIPSPMHAESLTKLNLSAEAESWYYPVLPGDEEWTLLTTKEKYEVCNMPNELLEVCSTEHLADLLLDYPFILEFWLYDDIMDGLYHLEQKTNIYNEFFSRFGSIDILIEKFEENVVDYDLLREDQNNHEQSLLVKSGFTREIFSQVYLGANYNTLSSDQILRINNTLEEKYEKQKAAGSRSYFNSLIYSEVQKCIGTVPTEIIPENLIEDIVSAKKFNSNLDWFFTYYQADSYEGRIVELLGSGYDFISECIIIKNYGTLVHSDYGNRSVSAIQYVGNLTSGDINSLNTYFQGAHSGVDGLYFLADASINYNCHFYAWVGMVPGNFYRIDSNNVQHLDTNVTGQSRFCVIESPSNLYTNNSQYVTPKGANTNAITGDIIVMNNSYGSPVHSVVVNSGGSDRTTIGTRAKMGIFGLYMGSLETMFEVYHSASSYQVFSI